MAAAARGAGGRVAAEREAVAEAAAALQQAQRVAAAAHEAGTERLAQQQRAAAGERDAMRRDADRRLDEAQQLRWQLAGALTVVRYSLLTTPCFFFSSSHASTHSLTH